MADIEIGSAEDYNIQATFSDNEMRADKRLGQFWATTSGVLGGLSVASCFEGDATGYITASIAASVAVGMSILARQSINSVGEDADRKSYYEHLAKKSGAQG